MGTESRHQRHKLKLSKSKYSALVAQGVVLYCAALFALCSVADAQQPGRVHRVGYISNAQGVRHNQENVFRQRLIDLGYIEGKTLILEQRFSKGQVDRLPDLAADLVNLKPDCIVATGLAPTRSVKNATNKIPIVMANSDDDPVRHGLISSLARPGGNVTGFISVSSELAGKRLELIKEIIPEAYRIAILWDPAGPGASGHVREAEAAARALKVSLQRIEVRGLEDVENAFRAAGGADALIVVQAAGINRYRGHIVERAVKARRLVMYSSSEFVTAGGLMSYAADLAELFRGAADYVGRILKGANPADLPVQQPTKFELVINLKAAKQIGLTIPPNVLARADKVIR